MKKIILLALSLLLFGNSNLLAQDWHLGGNTLSSSQRLGTNNSYSLIFETNGSDRGRITSGGNWGIGTSAPGSKLHVNSTVSGQSPFRVDVEGSNKLLMDQYGTVAIGTPIFTTSYKLLISSSTSNGIYANGLDFGLKASSPNIGVQGYGSVKGVFGYSNSTNGKGVNGYAEKGYGGFFESYDGTALYAKTYYGSYAAVFYGNTYSSGSYLGSDKNIKKNIREVGNALSIINQLKPKYYEFRDDAQYTSLHLPKGSHYGLLAQDVEEVLPNLVKEAPVELNSGKELKPAMDKKPGLSAEPKESMNIKAVNYTEMIPLLIKAVQEQDLKMQKQAATIEQQQQTINTLTIEIEKLKAGTGTGGNLHLNRTDLTGVSLEQNHPNPFNQITTFRYSIPTGAIAQIQVYDAATGKLVKTLPAPATGQLEMNVSDLEAGTYIYSLVVNGKQAASKQLILAK